MMWIADFLTAMLLLSLRHHGLLEFDVWLPNWLVCSTEDL